MARIEAIGIKTFEAKPGKRLVLAIEDAGIDILHRCGGNARCTTYGRIAMRPAAWRFTAVPPAR